MDVCMWVIDVHNKQREEKKKQKQKLFNNHKKNARDNRLKFQDASRAIDRAAIRW